MTLSNLSLKKEHQCLRAYFFLSFKMLMTHWEQLVRDMPNPKKYIQPGHDAAYEYYTCIDGTNAYIIAMYKFTSLVLFLLMT